MNPFEAFFAGVAPHHMPALIGTLLLPVGLWVLRRLAPGGTVARPQVSIVERWVIALLAIGAVVHLALPVAHFDSPLLTLGFLGSGVAYAWLALRIRDGKPWRVLTALLTSATVVAYLVVAGIGGEEPDQVGIATALVEMVAFGFAVIPLRGRNMGRRFLGTAGTAAVVVVVGALIWVGSFAAHQSNDARQMAFGNAGAVEDGAVDASTHSHGHDHAGRAQAGVLMRAAGADHHATVSQQQAADALAAETKTATKPYATLAGALAAGYELPGVQAIGPDVHLRHKTFGNDGYVLDPQRPEMLVYSIMDGRATLLGVVYVMEVAGQAAPQPGGPVTRWHAHNVCLSLLPPGMGIVSPYGGCPAFSVNVTSPEMMHVWVVDNPSGPFAEGLDRAWVATYHAAHGSRL